MERQEFSLLVGNQATSGIVYPCATSPAADRAGKPPLETPPPTLILAHGAGAGQRHAWMVAMAEAIASHAVQVVTFDFLYVAAQRRMPDRTPVLEATFSAAIDAVRQHTARGRLFIGGKSMGGRMATHVAVKDGVDVDGLVLLGYPLHPPGKPEQLRVAHLPKVRAAMLFVQGSRDPFGGPGELAPHVTTGVSGTRIFAVEGGDHSLVRPKSSGESPADTRARVAREIVSFIAGR